jgi:hypothetical protein
MVYWAFTTLSTVGFGDLYPVSNTERIFCTIILLFGVMIFSYILGNFTQILDIFIDVNSGLDDQEGLVGFFGLLNHFNHKKEIPL